MAVLTSRHTLDAPGNTAREALHNHADLLGALRLPTGAQRAPAGTDALTDLLVLRKRLPGESPWAAQILAAEGFFAEAEALRVATTLLEVRLRRR